MNYKTHRSIPWKDSKLPNVFCLDLPSISSMRLPKDGGGEWEESEWNDGVDSPYIKRGFKSAEDARKFIHNEFIFPRDLKTEAQANSRFLFEVLEDKSGGVKVLKDQDKGRFDARKTTKLVKDLAKGSFTTEGSGYFKQRQRKAPKRPHIAVVCNGNWSALWRDKDFVPRIAALTLSLTWAAEALNCEVSSGIYREIIGKEGHSDKLGVVMLQDTNEFRTSLHDYAVVLHRELYRCGNGLAYRQEGAFQDHGPIGWGGEEAVEPKHAVRFAREVQGASIVVAFGEGEDFPDADVHIKDISKMDSKEVIEKVAKMLKVQLDNRSFGE